MIKFSECRYDQGLSSGVTWAKGLGNSIRNASWQQCFAKQCLNELLTSSTYPFSFTSEANARNIIPEKKTIIAICYFDVEKVRTHDTWGRAEKVATALKMGTIGKILEETEGPSSCKCLLILE